jgi:hypothetical protein
VKKIFIDYSRKTVLHGLTKQNAGVEQIHFLKTPELMTNTVTIIMTNMTASYVSPQTMSHIQCHQGH